MRGSRGCFVVVSGCPARGSGVVVAGADEAEQRGGELNGVAVDPADEEAEQFGELDGVAEVDAHVWHGAQLLSVGAVRWMRPSKSAARSAWPWAWAWSR